jgi:hypothetical protein
MSWSNAVKKAVEQVFTRPSFLKPKVDWTHLVTLDFETYWDVDYTLRKMSTSEYIRDPRFKAHMVGIKIGRGKTKVVPTTKIAGMLKLINWKTHDLLCHNTAFDGFILSHHFGCVPRFYFDTLSMARGLHSNDIGASLDEVAVYYGVGNKIPNVLELSKGVVTLPKPLYTATADYCAMDVELCLLIFEKMLDAYPANELKLIHMTVSMFCDPVLKVDLPRVEIELAREVKYREDLMMSIVDVTQYEEKELLKTKVERELVGKERHMLMVKRIIGSNDRFANLLRAEGVEPPTKISPAWIKKPVSERKDEDKWTYAFAKDDADFIELPDRIDGLSTGLNLNKKTDIAKLAARQDRMRALVDCRLAVKSTTNITRAQRFLTAGANGMSLPVGYAYYRAHCLLGDAEVLTRNGWQRLDVWQGGDIAQWSPNFSMEFAAATANEFVVDEQIVVADSRYHSASYTRGHNVPGFTSHGKFKPRQAGVVAASRFELPLSGVLDGESKVSSLDMRLAAMTQADGSIRIDVSQGRCIRFGFRKERKIARCRQLLGEANIPFTEYVDSEGSTRITVGAAKMHLLLTLIDEETKQFLPAVYAAPAQAKTAFIAELSYWDGDVEPHGKGFTYSTTNQTNAETVQTVAHLAGMSAYISERTRGAWSDSYRVYIREDRTTRSEPKHYMTQHHAGKVYCPTTQTGYFLMRQNGKIVVTGNTGRWGGNNKMNMQNLTRGGELRLSILAPKGYVLVVGDSGQIEARVNGWLWGQHDLMDAFRDSDAGTGLDAYCNFAAAIYGREITKADKMERFVGKVCLGPDTRVYTNHGLRSIIDVRSTDLLWDGNSWVKHDGLLDQGVKETLTHRGLCATPDHEILTGHGWLEWSAVLTDRSLFQSALSLATSPSSGGSTTLPPKANLGGTAQYADVHAEPRQWSIQAASKADVQLGATPAQKLRLALNGTGSTSTLWQTTNTVPAFSTVCLRLYRDAATKITHRLSIMVNAGFRCLSSGAKIEHLFSGLYKRCLDGMSLPWRWTGSTLTSTMSQATSGSLQSRTILKTSGISPTSNSEFATSKQTTRTYDLANAGPNQRFTVQTDDGPVIVHNCVLGLGFQMGAAKLQITLAKGALGGPPVFFSLDECKRIINTYRRKNHRIQAGWEICKGIIEDMAAGRTGAYGALSWEKERVWLPNGMCLKYPDLRMSKGDKGWDEWSYQSKDMRKKIYGGLLCENIVQALARIIVAEQLLMVQPKRRVVMITHDEGVLCAPKRSAEAAFRELTKAMRTPLPWCMDLPLNSEGGFDVRYSK